MCLAQGTAGRVENPWGKTHGMTITHNNNGFFGGKTMEKPLNIVGKTGKPMENHQSPWF